METSSHKKTAEKEINLLDYLIVLARHSRMIVLATLGTMILTFVYLLIVPKQYTATARLVPPRMNLTLSGQLLEGMAVSSIGGGAAAGLGGMAASVMGLKNPNDIYIGMLNSDTIFDRIIARFDLKELFNVNYIEDARKKLGKIAIIESSDEGLITIEVTDKDQKRAADMANAFAEELEKLLQEIAVRDAKNQFDFLERERQKSLANLTKAEEEIRKFSEKTGVIQLDTQTRSMIEYISTLRAEINAKEVQIQVLKKQATPFNFDVVRLETEVTGLREKLREAERQADQACLGDVCLPTSKMPALGIEYIRLYREVKYQDTLYQLFCKLAELARLDGARNVSVAKVQFVDRAMPPEKKSKPLRILISLVVGTTVFFLLIVYVFVREYWEVRVKNEENAARLSQLKQYMEGWRRLKHIFLFFRKRP